jgi:hypothetical protein
MGLKRQLLDAVKAGYPDFNEETDSFTIEFSGGGDSFDSFSSIYIGRHGEDWRHKFEGEFSVTDNEDLLFEILEASGVEYNWNNAGTTGRIAYQENDDDGTLSVETVMSFESYGEVEDEE